MTPHEAGEKIIGYWRGEFTFQSIAILMVCLGVPLKTDEVKTVIRRLIDNRTENRDPKPGEVIWHD